MKEAWLSILSLFLLDWDVRRPKDSVAGERLNHSKIEEELVLLKKKKKKKKRTVPHIVFIIYFHPLSQPQLA